MIIYYNKFKGTKLSHLHLMNEDPEAVSTLHVPNPGRPVGRARHDEPLFHLDTEHPLPVAGEGVNSSVKPERSKLEEFDGSIR